MVGSQLGVRLSLLSVLMNVGPASHACVFCILTRPVQKFGYRKLIWEIDLPGGPRFEKENESLMRVPRRKDVSVVASLYTVLVDSSQNLILLSEIFEFVSSDRMMQL